MTEETGKEILKHLLFIKQTLIIQMLFVIGIILGFFGRRLFERKRKQ